MDESTLALLFEFSPGQSLEEVQGEYQRRLYVIMQDYLQGSQPITSYRNEFGRVVNDGITFAFIAGWADAGADALTDEAQSWISGRIGSEIDFVTSLFPQLKALREDDEIPMDDKLEAAQAHAEGYTQSLVGVYAHGKMMGEPEQMLTWHEGDTTDKCSTCLGLDGQRHPASWFLSRGYVPQEAGSNTLNCRGYYCRCRLDNDKGVQVIP